MNTPDTPTIAPVRHPTQKFISIVYLVGGGIGIITNVSRTANLPFELLIVVVWLLFLVQSGSAIYGGWKFWNNRTLGVQILYWVSWSCIPVISYSGFSYMCSIGLSLMPTITLGQIIENKYIFANINFNSGYDCQLSHNMHVTTNTVVVGVNYLAVSFVYILGTAMRVAGVSRLPFVRLN